MASPGSREGLPERGGDLLEDRKSTRLNSSHEWISYAVFCLKKKTQLRIAPRIIDHDNASLAHMLFRQYTASRADMAPLLTPAEDKDVSVLIAKDVRICRSY